MMGYGYEAMGGVGLVGTITWLVFVINGVLLAIWLWQKITKK